MNYSAPTVPALYSDFGADADLAELVEMFVDEMPQRIDRLQTLAAEEAWDELCRTAHQLKGSAGSYGFHQLTPAAFRLEQAARAAASVEEVQAATEELVDLCRRVRAGAPHDQSVG